MGLYAKFFAATYDRFIAGTEKAGLAERRRQLIGTARGDVLEIGGGTGNNLAYYDSALDSLTITEPEAAMLHRLERHARERGNSVKLVQAAAEDLPFDDASFDVVVSTLVLCGVRDLPGSLREIRRVLRPGGRLLFLEHVRSDDPKEGRRQDRMNPVNKLMVRCNCNRATLDAIQEAGFAVDSVEHGLLPKSPAFARPLIVGAAIAPTSVERTPKSTSGANI